MLKIGIWGDSIVHGVGDIDELGWATRLRKTLLQERVGTDAGCAEVYIRGVRGDTTKGLLTRFKVEADSICPDSIVIAIGINDSSYVGNEKNTLVPLSEFSDNLTQLAQYSRKIASKTMFVGLTRVDERLVQPLRGSATGKCYTNHIIEQYDAAIKDIAQKEKLHHVAISDRITLQDLDDGLHPNSAGHEHLAVYMHTAIKELT